MKRNICAVAIVCMFAGCSAQPLSPGFESKQTLGYSPLRFLQLSRPASAPPVEAARPAPFVAAAPVYSPNVPLAALPSTPATTPRSVYDERNDPYVMAVLDSMGPAREPETSYRVSSDGRLLLPPSPALTIIKIDDISSSLRPEAD